MTQQVYTLGYSGRTPEQLKGIMDQLGAYLFDIRYSPRSRQPQWAKKNLEALLGGRYLHLKNLGNVNYKGDGPIQTVDFEAGRLAIDKLASPVILMCACRDPEHCHRSVVGEKLAYMGYTVREIGEKAPSKNFIQRLFDLVGIK